MLKISINSFDSVPAFIGALNILFFPFSSFEPVPGKSGDWWIEPKKTFSWSIKISWVPLQWWTSKSIIPILFIEYLFSYRVFIDYLQSIYLVI